MQQHNLRILETFWTNGHILPIEGKKLRYELDLFDPYGHYLDVTLHLAEVFAGQQFALPVWIPGSYMVRDFAKHVISVSAEADGQPVALEMIDKSTWQLEQDCAELSITLRIFANDNSVRAAWFDERRAFINGTSVFLRPIGREQEPCSLKVQAPKHPALANWRMASGLDVIKAPAWGFGEFAASDYHSLVDHPLECGEFELFGFEACGVPHVMLLSGEIDVSQYDLERLATNLTAICENHIKRFEPETAEAPFNRYLFQTNVTANGYGGLEHRNSTALVCARKHLPLRGVEAADEFYQEFLGLCSHEYFHSWNVKRIAPAAFLRPDYQAENYSTQLWAFEGITSYFDDLGVYQSGCMDVQAWMKAVGQIITRVYRGIGREGQTLTESSFTAWTRFYQQDANATNAIVSYYAKGALFALSLDLTMRLHSNNQQNLEQLMRALWQRYGLTAQGVAEDDIENLAYELMPAHKVELKVLFDQGLRSTKDLPLQDLLQEFGVALQWRAAAAVDDKGGVDKAAWRVWTGMYWRQQGEELELMRVDNNSPAHNSGLSVKDRISAVNGYRPNAAALEKQLLLLEPGAVWNLQVFRGDYLLQKELRLEAAPRTTGWLSLMTDLTEQQQLNRMAWLQC